MVGVTKPIHEDVLGERPAALICFCLHGLIMIAEDARGPSVKVNEAPARLALRVVFDHQMACGRARSMRRYCRWDPVERYISPPQPGQFRPAQPRGQYEVPHPPEPVSVRGHHQAANLFRSVDGPLFRVVTGLVDGVGRVTREVTDAHRIVEGVVQDPVDVADLSAGRGLAPLPSA